MTPIPLAIHGATGKMGRRLVAHALEATDIALVAALARKGSPHTGMDAGTLAGVRACGVRVADTLPVVAPSVVVDFSTASAVRGAVELALAARAALVVCTTGLDDGTRRAIDDAALRIPTMVCANTSLGVNLLLALAERAARVLGADYDVEVVEMHHRHKVDSPSGTALALAEAVAAGHGMPLAGRVVHGRSGRAAGSRPAAEIAFHALRGGDVAGEHTLVFAGTGERIELTHRATSRDVFAAGALHAVRFLAGKPPGRYAMRDALGLGESGKRP